MKNRFPKNPYPGLRPFEFAENHLFFGREGQSEELLRRLNESHFVAVVGTSGSGKSSLVRAGLLPLLYGGFMTEAGARWRVALFRPGDNPIHNLSEALVKPTQFISSNIVNNKTTDKEETLKLAVTETVLRRSAVGLRDFANGIEFSDDENLLVVVDQFEELFRFKKENQSKVGTEKSETQEKAENEAAAFVKLLLEATKNKAKRVYVIITMRSDFLGDCSQFRDLPETINNGQYLMPRLTTEQLKKAIESPAKVKGAKIHPTLIAKLLNDIGDDQDQLPVLQHALMRTWDEWAKEENKELEINVDHYNLTGGMATALSRHADEIFSELENINSNYLKKKQEIAEILFKCLTETDRENREIRRPVSLKIIGDIAGKKLEKVVSVEEVISVIDDFRRAGRTFLMPPAEIPLESNSIIDISHESLIRKWGKLKLWIKEEAESAGYYRRLAEDAFLHYKEPSEKDLLSGAELKKAVDWQKQFKPAKVWTQIYYDVWSGQSLANYKETIKYLEDSKNTKINEIEAKRKSLEAEQKMRAEIERERKLREQAETEREQLREQAKLEGLSDNEKIGIAKKQEAFKQEIERLENEINERTKHLDLIKVKKSKISDISVKKNKRGISIADTYIDKAKEILRGREMPPYEVLILAKKLKNIKAFNFARRILERAGRNPAVNQDKDLKLKIYQQRALCTYKDNDLPMDLRLDEAMEILSEVENFKTTKDQETLGLIGAIFKRKWEVDNQKQQLERSLLYYRRGYEEGAENDFGYTGINAAFVLDWLAYQEEEEAKTAEVESLVAAERRIFANKIRADLIEKVAPLKQQPETEWLKESWWYYATLAEAHFGLQQYDEAVEWLEEGKKNIGEIPEWEEESAIQQLARLAIFQSDSDLAGMEFEDTPAWVALQKVFGSHPAAIRSAFTGKIGLGLSGGGFRASLYHIGTLAKLAELDVLRQVEVISCVSGGSMIGAHYYLEVRKLLESKSDEEITKQDYVEIVKRIEKTFLEGVQRNIRMRIAAEFTTNLKMMFSSKHSRTKRAGELYEEEIFSRVADGEGDEPRYLSELNIYPKDDVRNYNPSLHNWRRGAKVPMLVLNATTLNTGHNWQFTTTWMGEPPSSIDTEVDTNDQLRRMYYEEAPEEHQKIRLGYAVAASAGVPGLFDPLSLDNLYPDRIVRLVDGGVCDNQGINSLLEQDCAVILVSDGSGQMTSEKIPSNGLLGVPLRSNSILQARIRDTQYHDLERRRRSSLLRGLMYIHLKEDLDSDPIDWVNCADPIEKKPERLLTSFGIAKDIQQCLAATRTDLDSFTEVEAYSLMTSAYLMTENAFKNKNCVDGFTDNGETEGWKFLEIEQSLKGTGEKYEHIKKLLGVSNSLAFKVWRQSPALKIAAGFLALLALAAVVLSFFALADSVIVRTITIGNIGILFLGLLGSTIAVYLFGSLVQIIRWRQTLIRIGIGIGMCLFGWIIARIHLHIFDKIFLKRGSIDSLTSS